MKTKLYIYPTALGLTLSDPTVGPRYNNTLVLLNESSTHPRVFYNRLQKKEKVLNAVVFFFK